MIAPARPTGPQSISRRLSERLPLWLVWSVFLGLAAGFALAPVPAMAMQEMVLPVPSLSSRLQVEAQRITSWRSGEMTIFHLAGEVRLRQGQTSARAGEGILMVADDARLREMAGEQIDPSAQPGTGMPVQRILLYLEHDVLVEQGGEASAGTAAEHRVEDQKSWLGRWYSGEPMSMNPAAEPLQEAEPAIFQRARAALAAEAEGVRTVQFVDEGPGIQRLVSPLTGQVQTIRPEQVAPGWEPLAAERPTFNPAPQATAGDPAQPPAGRSLGGTGRTRVDIAARDSTVDLNLNIQTNPANPSERVYLASGGVRVTIDSPDLAATAAVPGTGTNRATIMADNIVAWQSNLPDGESRWEVYLEGNVVYAQGTRTIHAARMYYDANLQRGTILEADMLTPMQSYEGLIRLRSDVIQQMDANTLEAFGPAVTTSRMGVPRYWLQSDRLSVTREGGGQVDPVSGQPVFDPATGALQTDEEYFLESRNNRVYFSDTPVFFWPRFRTSLNDPTLYLDRIRLGNDGIFGTQIMTGWNMYQVLGLRNRPENTRWIGVVDYLSERGLALGSETDYQREGLFGYPGQVDGFWRSWFINDNGLDNLGRGRFNLVPEEERRGNLLGRHRHRFAPGLNLRAELGYLTDRNFLEQYYERRWDTEKDYTTGVWLERNVGTQSFNLTADGQVNDFFTQSSWLPRLDHYVLGQPLLGNRVVWHGHSSLGYARFRPANAPLDPQDAAPWDLLAWESADTDGIRMTTRQQLDLPLQLGPVKMVPYLLGDVSYWQEALDNNDLLRAYGQGGIRLSVPFWKVDPTVQSTLWNVNGLAHKISLEAELSHADASQNLDELPLYDPLDDDAQEAFRHRLAFNTFGIPAGGDVALRYDERYYALRRGMQGWVTGAVPEIADDLTAIRLGARQRFQTKRGLPGRERIIDWITFDTQVALFPEADRDNFGSTAGLFEYDFRWHLGDRVALLSDGMADFYSQGLRTASVGVQFNRPAMGDLYLGYRMIEGPISSNIVSASLQYRMSDKWGLRGSTAVDFGDTGSIGHSLSLLYIGESFLWRIGANADTARDNIGFVFGLEPRFLPRPRLFNPGGVPVGPAGARWLE